MTKYLPPQYNFGAAMAMRLFLKMIGNKENG